MNSISGLFDLPETAVIELLWLLLHWLMQQKESNQNDFRLPPILQ
jgi:hypothetical protein